MTSIPILRKPNTVPAAQILLNFFHTYSYSLASKNIFLTVKDPLKEPSLGTVKFREVLTTSITDTASAYL